ncbi:MAG TPA: thiamine pyrophosphate-dependent dehydrogenase E1 component subunit alpha [Gaiellaceae bacterium]|nr:thiamine pyrophosphate-dependent dehydrogenase E1 component subunit alpha [Gaiellaceae bacterium]
MPTDPCGPFPSVGREARLALYRLVLLQRLFEERALALYRQGRIAGSFYDGRGQEAVAAGAGLALGPDDVVCPLNRELACHFARGVTVGEAFRNFLGRGDGPTRGRDGNMHFGVPAKGVFPLVSMLGDLASVTVGAALAFRRRRQPRVALTFLGEGAFSVGDTHEALNLAGVWQVPAVFVLQSNGWSYSTPVERQMVNTNLAQRVYGGWSIPAERVDGTDALAVYDAVRAAVERARAGYGPQAVEALTLRIHGHAAHDDARYVPAELRAEHEERRDPVARLAERLRLDGLAADAERVREQAASDVADGLAEAEAAPAPDPRSLEDGVWAAPLPGEARARESAAGSRFPSTGASSSPMGPDVLAEPGPLRDE